MLLCCHVLTTSADVQAAHGGHLNTVRELLNHGANVPMSLLLSPLIQQPVKELLEKHLVVYVLWLLLRQGGVMRS